MSTLNHQRTTFTVASHFERPYGGFILGTKPFIKEVLQGIKAQDLESQDTLYRKTLRMIFPDFTDTQLGYHNPPFISQRELVQCRMSPDPVIEHLDVFKDALLCNGS